ncbi:MAG: tetratricopeptide repeat protein [Bacteriovoracaceae bacterium]|nr:tetratricopeptide repeat protein [Bacteriovoracaceae bacterium]
MLRVLLIAITALLISCSHQIKTASKPVEKNKHLTAAEVEKLNQQATNRVSEQLKSLAIAAKASGKDKVNFLASDMYLKASAAQMEGDFATSNLILEHLVELVPNDPFILKKRAIGLIRVGELEKSQEILETLYKSEKDLDENTALVLAGVYSSLGKVAPAQKVYKKILSKNPKNEDACIFLSKSHLASDNFKKAVSSLKKCEKSSPGRGLFSYYIGKMYVDKGDVKNAKRYFVRAAKIEPEFSQATMALGLVHEERGQNEKAISIYKKYLKQRPNDVMILSRLVQLMFSTQKFTQAIPFAERLSDYDPDNLNLKVKLGILYTDDKKYHKAITTFKELLSAAPNNDKILYYLGAIYQELKKFEDSIEYFSRVPATSGLYQDSSLQAAQMLSALALDESIDGAGHGSVTKKFLAHIKAKSKEIKELEVEFQVILAGFYENIQENELAIDALEEVAGKENFTDNHTYYLASLYEKEEMYEKVFPLIEELIKQNPTDAYAYNFLGYSLLEKGEKLDEAFHYISKAVELKPEDGYIRDSLGWYFYKTGDVERALEELQKAATAVPDDISIQKHLAIVYGKLKNFSKAKHYIVNAIGLAKFESEKQELKEVLKNLDAQRLPASFLEE